MRIAKSDILKLITRLSRSQTVYVPQRADGEIIFAPFEKDSNVVLDYPTTVIPPKALFFPPEEELFRAEGKRIIEPEAPKSFIVFGLDKRDLAALCQLDEILKREPADSFYLKRREKATIIAISDETGEIQPGGDLILEDSGDHYRAVPLTKAGHKVTKLSVFKKRADDPKPTRKAAKATVLEELLNDSELLARAVGWSRENYPEIWERLGKQCLGCGICTYVCPLCYCFATEDRVDLDGTTCTRCRHWDACTLPDFATVAGGHSFRPDLKGRYYNWFYHKFVRAYKEFGRSQCVACGRCQKYCPAGINIEEVLMEIVERYEKANRVGK
jgi:sulfhydrogenase subunit beta (sulfur reductase)